MIILPISCRHAVHAACEAAYPGEACGLLVGSERAPGVRHVALVVRGRNVAAAADRFTLDPADLLHADAVASGRGLDIVGTFHSHPASPARPSALDAAYAQRGWSHVIVRVDARAGGARAGPTTSYAVDGGGSLVEERIAGRAADVLPAQGS